MASDSSIEKRARFDFVRYANLWEDADVLCEALSPDPSKRILSIASAGDNSFALLAEGAEVVAVDLNPAQIACADLKRVAIENLSYAEVLEFFGISPSTRRLKFYRDLRSKLLEESRSFWDQDQNTEALYDGFIHSGKFERYFQTFRRWILPLIAGRKKIAKLLSDMSPAERLTFYNIEWNSWRWRCLFKIFFSRTVMGRGGRDPEFFRYVDGSVGDRILARAEFGLTELPNDKNPYLQYILRGNYGPALPRYLRPEVFERVRAGLPRFSLHLGTIEEVAAKYPPQSFDGFNLSDIFEYLNPEISERVYGALLTAARPKARFAYWNMLVPRTAPKRFEDRIRYLEQLSKKLFRSDLAFFYSAFRIEEVG